MRLLPLVVFLGVACAAPVHAADLDAVSTPTAPPAKTRAEVKAETRRAIAAGEVRTGDVSYPTDVPVTRPRSSRARAVAPSPTTP